MTIRHRKVGNKVYLEQYRSYREGGKVKTEFVKYLGREGKSPSKLLPTRHLIDQIKPSDSVRAGDVNLLWTLAQNLHFSAIIDKFCNVDSTDKKPTPGVLLTMWAINRVIDPESATQLGKWVHTTDLPRLTDTPLNSLNKDSFLFALDEICKEDETTGKIIDIGPKIEEEMYAVWRNKYPLPQNETETLAYDLTAVLFSGITCPLAELGYNHNGIDQLQINVALLLTRRDRIPVAHSVYEGSRHGVATVKNFLAHIIKIQHKGGTLIWDRGMVSKENVQEAEGTGWNLVCGLPKTVKSVCDALKKDIPLTPETLVRWTKTTRVYAIENTVELYGKMRRVIIYKNASSATREADERNTALAKISERLSELEKKGADWPEAKLHQEIAEIVGRYKVFLNLRVKRKSKPRIEWSYKQSKLRAAEKNDGKWALLVTDPNLSVKEAVKIYLEKDFIEKGFRTMKNDEELEPVRHRLERRVRAYLFVQVLALRLRSALRWLIENSSINKEGDAWEIAEELLRNLGRVERMEVKMGNSQRIWHLNLLKQTKEQLKKIGFGKLYEKSV